MNSDRITTIAFNTFPRVTWEGDRWDRDRPGTWSEHSYALCVVLCVVCCVLCVQVRLPAGQPTSRWVWKARWSYQETFDRSERWHHPHICTVPQGFNGRYHSTCELVNVYYCRTHWGGSTRVLGWTLGRLLAEAPIWLADRFSDCWFNKLEAKPAWYCNYTNTHIITHHY